MSLVTDFDFSTRHAVSNAYGIVTEIGASNGDIYISDATSSFEIDRKYGQDKQYVTVTFSNGAGILGYLSYEKVGDTEVSAFYRPVNQ